MKPLTIALIHNLKPAAKTQELPPDYYSECDSEKTIAAIAKALEGFGHTVLPVEADRHLPKWLHDNRVDLAFNIAEGFRGEAREARVPALLELLEIPYTGSGVLALSLALDKARSKKLFLSAGVPTPKFQLFSNPQEPLSGNLHFPLIVKPNCEGSGKGIWAESVVHQEGALRTQVQKVFDTCRQEVLVEEYIEGMELTVGILGQDSIVPILEVDFSECAASGEYFYSWRMKEFQGNKEMHLVPRFWCPARLDAAVTQAVQKVALKAAVTVGFRDVARVDIRLSSEGIPYVLEVNPLPGLDPEESNLPLMAKAAGISYEALIHRLVLLACERALPLRGLSPSFIPLSHRKKSAPAPSREHDTISSVSQKRAGSIPAKPEVTVEQEENLGR